MIFFVFSILLFVAPSSAKSSNENKVTESLLDATDEYFSNLDETTESACRWAAIAFVGSLRSGQDWDYAVREATRAVEKANRKSEMNSL